MKLKKRGFLLLELSVALVVFSLLILYMLDAYKQLISSHQRVSTKLKALLHLNTYIHSLQSDINPPNVADFTCSHVIIKKTPRGRAAIIKASVSWKDEYQVLQELSFEAGLLI